MKAMLLSYDQIKHHDEQDFEMMLRGAEEV